MTNYKITIMYDGRQYNGWQKQGNTDKTIQGKIETLFTRLEGYEVEIHGAGRTDAGVHALGQVFNVKLSTKWDVHKLKATINEYLPADIAVINVEIVDDRFHARLSAVRKTYRYRIYIGDGKDVFNRYYVYQYPNHNENQYQNKSYNKNGNGVGAGKCLDVEKIKKAAALLCGTHDFKSFCANKKMKKSTVRTIEKIDVTINENELVFDFTGDGFLYNMVRMLVGTLIEVGEGKRKPEDMKDIILGKDRALAGPTAPAQGLTLVSVEY